MEACVVPQPCRRNDGRQPTNLVLARRLSSKSREEQLAAYIRRLHSHSPPVDQCGEHRDPSIKRSQTRFPSKHDAIDEAEVIEEQEVPVGLKAAVPYIFKNSADTIVVSQCGAWYATSVIKESTSMQGTCYEEIGIPATWMGNTTVDEPKYRKGRCLISPVSNLRRI